MNAAVVLADGTVFSGRGAGATGRVVGEICFNTALAGHQEVLSDPSYARQIVCFTAPHVGNTGANDHDDQAASAASVRAACGAILRAPLTPASNWRAEQGFDAWLAARGLIAIAGVDTRALTRRIRERGMPHGALAYSPDAPLDHAALAAEAAAWSGVEGADLAVDMTTDAPFDANAAPWRPSEAAAAAPGASGPPQFTVVVVDYGAKQDIVRHVAALSARVRVVGARATAPEILALAPDGVVLSNGPGDPAATAAHAGATIRVLADSGVPMLAVCLGHQMLALALGGRTVKMAQGHHGANHPVHDLETGRVEIASMNHGFTVDRSALPPGARETYVSLFDGTNSGLAFEGRPILSVQHHPEAAPGPHDALGVFARFRDLMAARRG